MNLERQEYNVKQVRLPIRIDGQSDNPAWKNIEPLELDHYMGEEPTHRPLVQAKLAWDDDALFVIFRVEDRYVRAVAKKHQDPVCRDSCVEFFFTPGSGLGLSYFNLEINCGGTMLFWWHPEGEVAIPIADKDCELIKIAHSLPKIVDPEIEEPTIWKVEYRLPFSTIERYCPEATKPMAGTLWNANFYKCADASSHPHWLTWSLVAHPTPRFHSPEFFGTLAFE